MPEPRSRVAAIDCGTNSIRLLVSDIDGDEKTDLLREMRIVRLGEGVDRTGHLSEEAIQRTLQATREYAEIIAMFGVTHIRFCATSAVRDADNAVELEDAVEGILGVRLEVLAGLDEAQASFVGATRDLPGGRTLVVDIGGGSTELVVGTGDDIEWSVSLDIGSVRLTERFLGTDPASVADVTACIEHVDSVLAPVVEQIAPVDTFVGVAGTITTVAAHSLALPSYDSQAIHLARLHLTDVSAACLSLVQMSVADRRRLPFMHPGRADVIGGGAIILDRLVALLPLRTDTLVVSEHDILDGIVWGTVSTPS
ncbi:Ppx/GppA phosphatase family protein [Aeromicrobium wangtongii]|uniref:Ppx/GppA family phosphatase n=1 Tax=Aeromicrobium wangtongii TaxID=2969247 RepID=A0ABY5MBB6_9ACTN|nr:Ppx/GppA phosphatase family protein [Aeromicrobium wangtongii]MCD9196910.1 Ppx/GppA family phosphatase [Aeromicrobium wangtongii]UUP14416.1 Ppx/GppA family phosphatase [Aeromicrobium wangtongii]